MKRKLFSLLLTVCMVATLMPVTTAHAASTTTVPTGYTAIYTASDLDAVRNNLSGNYILMNDIDLGSWGEWIPIGEYQYYDPDSEFAFSGVLDGNGHSIYNIYITDKSKDYSIGLFSKTYGATIKDLYISGNIICSKESRCIGAFVGHATNDSLITNCTSNVTIDYHCGDPLQNGGFYTTGNGVYIGGIVGSFSNRVEINECANYGTITCIGEKSWADLGGIIGGSNSFARDTATITNCYNTGSLSVSTSCYRSFVGGIYGYLSQYGNISKCYNAGTVSLSAPTHDNGYWTGIGGIGGGRAKSGVTMSDCYYMDSVSRVVGLDEGMEPGENFQAKSCNTSEMQKQSTFAGFDFNSVWVMGDGSYPYPILRGMEGPIAGPTLTRYMVTFDATGGYTSTVAMTVVVGRTYGELPVPTRTGYTFEGWYTAENGGIQVTSSTEVHLSSDQTLYAHWKANGNVITITFNANGGAVGATSKTVTSGGTYGELPTPVWSGYSFDGWFTSASGGTQITSTTTVTQAENHTLYAHWTSAVDLYNLGDETYSFSNFGDSDSLGGHCFGMSITSAGYHNNLLDISKIGGNTNTPLYSFSKTQTVTQPICYYQGIQGSYSANAIVAGGSTYLTGASSISTDWQAVVNYVKNHDYDGTGVLQIGYRKNNEGGHAINFLRYENVNGQDRIYAYDNNFPNQETYFYQDSSGRIWQEPKHTFSGAIDCIALRDCRIYLNSVGDFDATHVLYMVKDAATVQGDYTYSYMEAGFSDEEYVMYEIPADVNQVTIIPHRNNAKFVYMDTTYSFGEITDETHGELTLASVNSGTANTGAGFKMYEGDLLLNPFTDVPINAYYYDAVQWAVKNGVTTGTSATTFSPNADCTRAQIVTFLWRANGSPEPTSTNNPFKDVKASDYYYKSVLWAAENGITVGTSPSTFSPNDACTRGQAVTFLYRTEHSPTVTGSNSFTDVQSNAYYSDAVTWAVVNGITYGTGYNTFSPDATCTRAQIVTFLYRDKG